MPAPVAPTVTVGKRTTNRASASRTSGSRSSGYPKPRGHRIRVTLRRKRRTRA